MEDDSQTSFGSTRPYVALMSTVNPKKTVTAVSLRPEDVQAIVFGLAANPSALASVVLMMQSDSQQAVSLANRPASSS